MKRKLVAGAVAGLAVLAVAGCGTRQSGPTDLVQSLWAESHFQIGRKAEGKFNSRTAVLEYRRALRRDPNHTPTLKRLAELYTAQGEYAKALPLWKRHLEAAGRTADAYNDLGYCYDLAGLADPAEAAYLHGVAADPTNVRCRTNYGLFLARRGRRNEALLHLRAAMAPADAHYNLAVVLEDRGERLAARAEYRRALALDPEFGEARMRLAGIE